MTGNSFFVCPLSIKKKANKFFLICILSRKIFGVRELEHFYFITLNFIETFVKQATAKRNAE